MPTQEEILAEFYERRRRKERHDRVGTGFADPAYIVEPGIGIASPVTVAEGQRAATLVWAFETLSDGVLYPDGVMVGTGGASASAAIYVDTGTIAGLIPTPPALVMLPSMSSVTIPGGGIPPSGFHTYALFVDPPNNRGGIFVDGVQVSEATGAFTAWADGVSTWTYMNTVTGVGSIDDLHIFMDFVPPGFVG